MNYISKIKSLKGSDLRQFLKENDSNETLIEEVVSSREEVLPHLLENKVLPEFISLKLAKADSSLLADALISSNYTPSLDLLEELNETLSDESMLRLITSFPTIPYSIQFVMVLINTDKIFSAQKLVMDRPPFQKPEILIYLVNPEYPDKEIPEAFLGEEIISLVTKKFSSRTDDLPVSENYLKKVMELCSGPLSFNLVKEYIEDADMFRKMSRSTKSTHNPYSKNSFDYKPFLEEIKPFEVDENVNIKNPPKNSIHRMKYLKENLGEVKNDEAHLFINSCSNLSYLRHRQKIASFLKDFQVVKQLDLNNLSNLLSPQMVAQSVSNKPDIAIYLLENMPSKFHSELEKVIPADLLPNKKERKPSKKRSFFFECFESIQKNNVDDFRSYITGPYTLYQFTQDTYQGSKKESCQRTSISFDFYSKLEKDELFDLFHSNFHFSDYSEKKKNKVLKFKLSVEEAETVASKISVTFAFDSCENKVKFLETIDKESMSDLFSNRRKEILEDASLLKSYLKRAKTDNEEYGVSQIEALGKILDFSELKEVVKFYDSYSSKIVFVKAKDGKYFLTDQEILNSFTNDRQNFLDKDDFIESMMKRNEELGNKIIDAYIGGNEALSKLVGKKVSIRRNNLSQYQALRTTSQKPDKEIMDQVFEKGIGRFDRIKKEVVDWKKALQKYGKGKTVSVNRIAISSLDQFEDLPETRFIVKHLDVNDRWARYGMSAISSNIQFENVYLSGEITFSSVRQILTNGKDVKFLLEGDFRSEYVIELLALNINIEDSELHISEIIDKLKVGRSGLITAQALDFLTEHGLIVNPKVIQAVVAYTVDPEAIMWLSSRVGKLSDYYRTSEPYMNETLLLALKKSGVKMVTNREDNILDKMHEVKDQGVEFEDLDVSSYSHKEKSDMISFIEEKIDPRYVQLKLHSNDLGKLEKLSSFSKMKMFFETDESTLPDLFLMPENIRNNKKAQKSIRDLVTLSAGKISFKVFRVREVMEILDPKIEMLFSDFFTIDAQSNIEENEKFSEIDENSISAILTHKSIIHTHGVLKGKSKAELLRFVRSLSGHGSRYVKDILELVEEAFAGLKSLKEAKLDETLTVEEVEMTDKAYNSVSVKIEQIKSLNDAEMMHDQLMDIVKLLQANPKQLLNQNKFIALEKDKKIQKYLNLKLVFPKSRADLSEIGDIHGWCVNNTPSYGTDIINKGNILVALAPVDSAGEVNDIVALAHFLKEKNGIYSIEQLKWSEKVKGKGSRNVDALDDFDHVRILDCITSYLDSLENNEGGK